MGSEMCIRDSTSVSSLNREASSVRGFPVDEIHDVFGSASELDDCCGNCPANAASTSAAGWAGCFGWLPAASDWDLSSANDVDAAAPIEDLPELIHKAITEQCRGSHANEFGTSHHGWYGLWQTGVMKKRQLEVLEKVVNSIKLGSQPWRHFQHAVTQCLEHQLDLHTELIPPGVSDGSSWTIAAHCPDCSAVHLYGTCIGCGRVGNPTEPRKLKVLGFHPYLRLEHLWGEDKTTQFIERYLESRSEP